MLWRARMYRHAWDSTILTTSDAGRFVAASSRHTLQIAFGHLLASRGTVGVDQGTLAEKPHIAESLIDHQSQKKREKRKKKYDCPAIRFRWQMQSRCPRSALNLTQVASLDALRPICASWMPTITANVEYLLERRVRPVTSVLR
jgi:hypothetical protein